MRVLYGHGSTFVDVTSHVLATMTCTHECDLCYIPRGDLPRFTEYKTDPVPGVLKTVIVYDDLKYADTGLHVPHTSQMWIRRTLDSSTGLHQFTIVEHADTDTTSRAYAHDATIATAMLTKYIHPTLNMRVLKAGDVSTESTTGIMASEFPEQVLITRTVRPTAKVLELGGNIGRSSCVIASLLDDTSRLVVLESDPVSAASLYRNRVVNKFNFHVEVAALSERPLMQKDWITLPVPESAIMPQGWSKIHTITFAQLIARYGTFDTVVADCEGALTGICRDTPHFFHGVTLVVLENDFVNEGDKDVVDAAMRAAGLNPVISQAGGWGRHAHEFYQVWAT